MQFDKTLHVVFTADNNYLIHWVVVLESLFANNTDVRIISHFVYDGIDEKKLEYIKNYFKNKFNRTIKFYKIDSSIMDTFKISHHINKSTYFRLILSDILPKEIKKILFLDCDLIIENSLKELVQKKFDKKTIIYAVNHFFKEEQKKHLIYFGIDKTANYFNAGVMLINLEKIRRNNMSKTLMNFAMKEKEKILWWDQDVLNVVFKDNWKELHPKYNLIWEIIDSSLKEAQEAKASPTIIHFTRSVKPWHSNSYHPYKELYWKYRKRVEDIIKEIE